MIVDGHSAPIWRLDEKMSLRKGKGREEEEDEVD